MKIRTIITIILLFVSTLSLHSEAQAESAALRMDAETSIGTLPNGLTYYIRENSQPQNRAYLRLVVNAGSILEDEDQLGLAHMAEHMAFNGTQKYAKSEIVDYLESIGMRFGPEINAYTSFDETVYMLQVPTGDPEKLEKGFDVLSQWAFAISFEDEEIDKERGVIVEEWRTGLGAGERLRRKQFPILFNNSRYARRLPIGEMDIIEKFEYDTIRRFYRDWYKPEHMAVIAVGDFNPEQIAGYINDYFSYPASGGPVRERPTYQVPEHAETLYALAEDPELPYTQISMYIKGEAATAKTEADYRLALKHRLYSTMLNARLTEIVRSPGSPFLAAQTGRTDLVRPVGVNYLFAVVEGNQVSPALYALQTEARRAAQYGFTDGELKRAKAILMSDIVEAYAQRDKAESSEFMTEYTDSFLTGKVTVGIEKEYELHNSFLPDITKDEVNTVAQEYISDKNRVILVSTIEGDGLDPVTEQELRTALAAADNATLTAYEDDAVDAPILANKPPAGSVVDRKYYDDTEITQWTLSNGVSVYLKSTDFKPDEVSFSAFSPGGTSMYDESDYLTALYAPSVVQRSGIGTLSATNLEKTLAGKNVRVTPFIGQSEEGVRGSSSKRDLDTFFQLLHSHFTSPRWDEDAFDNLERTLQTVVQNRESQPNQLFSDRVRALLANGHYTSDPLTTEAVSRINGRKTIQIYRERFGDADDFSFLFAGDITPDELEPYLIEYVASLPSLDSSEGYRDIGIRRPAGIVEDQVYAGIEQKSQVITIFHGEYPWSRETEHLLSSLADAVRIRLREVLREDASGTYGVGVNARLERYPRERFTFQIFFGTSPDRVEELADLAMSTVKEFVSKPIPDLYVTKIKETQKEQFALQKEDNSFWLREMKAALVNGRDFADIEGYSELVESLDGTKLSDVAQQVLDFDHYVRVFLYPTEDTQ